MLCSSGSQDVVHRPTVSAPGKASDMKILRPQPRPNESETLWVASSNLCFSNTGDSDTSSRLRTPSPGQCLRFIEEECEA